MIMTNDDRIKHLRDMLKEAASHLNHSMQQDGTADDVYMRDVESLAVAIRALEARGWAALERPIAREIKMLDAIFGVITDMLFECDRSMFSAVLNYWEEEQQANPKEETTETYHSASVLYPGDQIYFKSKFRPTYQVNIYEKFQHTWEFENTGTQVWRGRRLYFLNHDAVRPRADANYIDIPDTPPHKGVKITVSMDARGFEGKSECKWIMVDNDDNDCFPNSNTFTFFVSAKFEYQK